MKTIGFMLTLSMFLLVPICHLYEPLADTQKAIPGIEWDRRLGDSQLQYNPQALSLSPKDKTIWIAGTASPSRQSGKENTFWLWQVDQQGKRVRRIEITSPQKDAPPPSLDYPHVKSMVAHESGDVFVVIEFIKADPWLIKVDDTGSILFRKHLDPLSSDIVIHQIITTRDDDLLLIGRNSQSPFMIKVNRSGDIIWTKSLENVASGVLLDGLSLPNRGVVLVGNSGAFYQPVGESAVWVVKADLDGNVEEQRISFRGRNGSVAQAPGQDYMIVYDQNNLEDTRQSAWVQQIYVRRVDRQLGSVWNKRVLVVDKGLGRFSIVRATHNSFLIVGSKRNQLWIARIDHEGKYLWQFFDARNVKTMSGHYFTVTAHGRVFILYRAYSEGQDGRAITKVGLIKFTVT